MCRHSMMICCPEVLRGDSVVVEVDANFGAELIGRLSHLNVKDA